MKRRTKFLLAATAAIAALGFAFYRLYIPHTTTSAISKFGFAGASALRAGGYVRCRRVFTPDAKEVRNFEERGVPVPPTEYSSWVILEGDQRDAVQRALAEEIEAFVNFDTACHFHTDVEIIVYNDSLYPVFTVELCTSCNKWRTNGGKNGRFAKDSVLATLASNFRPYNPPTLTETFGPEAAAAISSHSRIAIRRVFADHDRKHPKTYSVLQDLSQTDAESVRALFASQFTRAEANPLWVKACLYHPDMQFFIYDPLDQLVARIELCLGCGDWIMPGVAHGGYGGKDEFKRIMIETCTPLFFERFTE
jgi:hypothetical protein